MNLWKYDLFLFVYFIQCWNGAKFKARKRIFTALCAIRLKRLGLISQKLE